MHYVLLSHILFYFILIHLSLIIHGGREREMHDFIYIHQEAADFTWPPIQTLELAHSDTAIFIFFIT